MLNPSVREFFNMFIPDFIIKLYLKLFLCVSKNVIRKQFYTGSQNEMKFRPLGTLTNSYEINAWTYRFFFFHKILYPRFNPKRRTDITFSALVSISKLSLLSVSKRDRDKTETSFVVPRTPSI